MKKNLFYYVLIVFILVSSVLIRLNNLDKIPGFWYDELTIYSIGSKSSILAMFQEDSHRFLLFPLYYLIYKFWLILFGNSDYAIRLMSVFFDVASVICAYFAGINFAMIINKNEVKEKIGLFSMLLYAINSSFIYYAQEAKFYSLTFFLINIFIIFWTKFLKEQNKQNTVLFLISNALLLYTYTSQILLILSIQIITFIYFIFYKRDYIKKYFYQLTGMSIVLIPLLLMIIYDHKYFSGNFDAVVYDNSFILQVLQNYFSPILVSTQNNILSYHYFVLSNILNPKFWIFILFPVTFNLILLIKGCKNQVFAKMFLWVALLYIVFHILLTEFTHYAVMVRYTLPALPFLIIVGANGLEVLCKNKRGYILFFIFICINLIAVNSSIGATKIVRPESYKSLADILIKEKISPDADFVMPIRVSLLDKYFYIKGQRFNLYSLNAVDCQKTYLNEKEISEINKKENLYKNYKRFLSSKVITKDFENYVVRNYISPTKNQLVVLEDTGICIYDRETIDKILNSGDEIYKKLPIQFLRLSKLEDNLITVLSKKMKTEKVLVTNNWKICVFSKIK